MFWNYAACAFTVLISLALPVAVLYWCAAGQRGRAKSFLWGAVCFTVFQLLTRIPLLNGLLPGTDWYLALSIRPLGYSLFLGATAALFEEGGRYLVMGLCMKKRRDFEDAVAFGLGHGGIEAAVLTGVNALAVLLFYSSMVAPMDMFLAGLERLFAITLHVAYSVMVMKSLRGKKPWGLLAAFISHALLDAGSAYLGAIGLSLYWVEGMAAVLAALSAAYIWREKKRGGF